MAFRNFLTPFSFDLPSKLLQVLVILMFFLVVVATFANYPYYYREYEERNRNILHKEYLASLPYWL